MDVCDEDVQQIPPLDMIQNKFYLPPKLITHFPGSETKDAAE
jgi:hypothetical protein